MGSNQGIRHPTFRVLDAMDAPHGGRILRLRLQSGEAPSIGELRGARPRRDGAARPRCWHYAP